MLATDPFEHGNHILGPEAEARLVGGDKRVNVSPIVSTRILRPVASWSWTKSPYGDASHRLSGTDGPRLVGVHGLATVLAQLRRQRAGNVINVTEKPSLQPYRCVISHGDAAMFIVPRTSGLASATAGLAPLSRWLADPRP